MLQALNTRLQKKHFPIIVCIKSCRRERKQRENLAVIGELSIGRFWAEVYNPYLNILCREIPEVPSTYRRLRGIDPYNIFCVYRKINQYARRLHFLCLSRMYIGSHLSWTGSLSTAARFHTYGTIFWRECILTGLNYSLNNMHLGTDLWIVRCKLARAPHVNYLWRHDRLITIGFQISILGQSTMFHFLKRQKDTKMPTNADPGSPLTKPLSAIAVPGMYLFYKYSEFKRQQQEVHRKKVTEKELDHLNHKIVSVFCNRLPVGTYEWGKLPNRFLHVEPTIVCFILKIPQTLADFKFR